MVTWVTCIINLAYCTKRHTLSYGCVLYTGLQTNTCESNIARGKELTRNAAATKEICLERQTVFKHSGSLQLHWAFAAVSSRRMPKRKNPVCHERKHLHDQYSPAHGKIKRGKRILRTICSVKQKNSQVDPGCSAFHYTILNYLFSLHKHLL